MRKAGKDPASSPGIDERPHDGERDGSCPHRHPPGPVGQMNEREGFFFRKIEQCKFLLEYFKGIDRTAGFRVDRNDADAPAPYSAGTPDKFPVIRSTPGYKTFRIQQQ